MVKQGAKATNLVTGVVTGCMSLCMGDAAQQHTAQKDCGVSFLEGFQGQVRQRHGCPEMSQVTIWLPVEGWTELTPEIPSNHHFRDCNSLSHHSGPQIVKKIELPIPPTPAFLPLSLALFLSPLKLYYDM